MKLSLLYAFIVMYALLAAIWVAYAGLPLLYQYQQLSRAWM